MIRQDSYVIKYNLLDFRFFKTHQQTNQGGGGGVCVCVWGGGGVEVLWLSDLIDMFYSRSVFLDISNRW